MTVGALVQGRPVTDSWWLKFDRAQEHRVEAERMISALLTRADATLRVEASYVDSRWIYTIHRDLTIDERLAVVIGDFLFGLRSALDHILARNLTSQLSKTHFPIFHEDFLSSKTSEVKRFANYRKTWKALEAQLPQPVFKVIELVQPFIGCQISGTDPAEAALSILNELQNRDKHASLGVVDHYIANAAGFIVQPAGERVQIAYPGQTAEMVLVNGQQIFEHPDLLRIDFTDNIRLAVVAGPEARHRPLPESFDDITEEVRSVLKMIERNM